MLSLSVALRGPPALVAKTVEVASHGIFSFDDLRCFIPQKVEEA
jgi:hypothetical protein